MHPCACVRSECRCTYRKMHAIRTDKPNDEKMSRSPPETAKMWGSARSHVVHSLVFFAAHDGLDRTDVDLLRLLSQDFRRQAEAELWLLLYLQSHTSRMELNASSASSLVPGVRTFAWDDKRRDHAFPAAADALKRKARNMEREPGGRVGK